MLDAPVDLRSKAYPRFDAACRMVREYYRDAWIYDGRSTFSLDLYLMGIHECTIIADTDGKLKVSLTVRGVDLSCVKHNGEFDKPENVLTYIQKYWSMDRIREYKQFMNSEGNSLYEKKVIDQLETRVREVYGKICEFKRDKNKLTMFIAGRKVCVATSSNAGASHIEYTWIRIADGYNFVFSGKKDLTSNERDSAAETLFGIIQRNWTEPKVEQYKKLMEQAMDKLKEVETALRDYYGNDLWTYNMDAHKLDLTLSKQIMCNIFTLDDGDISAKMVSQPDAICRNYHLNNIAPKPADVSDVSHVLEQIKSAWSMQQVENFENDRESYESENDTDESSQYDTQDDEWSDD